MRNPSNQIGFMLFGIVFFLGSLNFVIFYIFLCDEKVTDAFDGKFDRNPSYPWEGDQECEHFVVQGGLVEIIQYINEIECSKQGDHRITDDPRCGCTIMDKDHEATLNNGLWHYFQLLHREGLGGLVHQQYDRRGVLLLRNPMDVVFTFRNWAYGGKVGIAPSEAFKGPAWEETIDMVAFVWADHAIRWIEQIEKGTVIFYEKLIGENGDAEIERLLQVINFFPIDRKRLRCTMKHRNRSDHRRFNKSRFFLEPRHQIKIMESIHKVQQSLRRKGWPRLPVYLFDFHNPEDGKR